jgi:hypothetical protein
VFYALCNTAAGEGSHIPLRIFHARKGDSYTYKGKYTSYRSHPS